MNICSANDWWEGIPGLYEVAIEVSTNWRRLGIAKALLEFALKPDYFEEGILYGLGFAWHWDLEEVGMEGMRCDEKLSRLFEQVGFEHMAPTEPNIQIDPAHIFLARIGSKVSPGKAA